MSEKYWATLITAVLGIGIITCVMVINIEDQWRALNGAVAMFIEISVMLLTALVLRTGEKTKPISNGILLGTAITLVIGFGVCSAI
jgi:hypothetical protein